VRWRGYDRESDNTWEPLRNLAGSENMIAEFERQHAADYEKHLAETAARKAAKTAEQVEKNAAEAEKVLEELQMDGDGPVRVLRHVSEHEVLGLRCLDEKKKRALWASITQYQVWAAAMCAVVVSKTSCNDRNHPILRGVIAPHHFFFFAKNHDFSRFSINFSTVVVVKHTHVVDLKRLTHIHSHRDLNSLSLSTESTYLLVPMP
jgi:hypothetical protein